MPPAEKLAKMRDRGFATPNTENEIAVTRRLGQQ
jgi:hypothetical protein